MPDRETPEDGGAGVLPADFSPVRSPPVAGRTLAPVALGPALAVLLFLTLAGASAIVDPPRADEIYTWRLARLPAADAAAYTARDSHPPLSYVAFGAIFDRDASPADLRLAGIAFGAAAVALAGAIGGMLAGRNGATLAAAALAALPQWIVYGKEARMYPVAVALELLVAAAWIAEESRPRFRAVARVAFVLGSAAALYTHNHCIPFVGAIFAFEVARAAREIASGAALRRAGWGRIARVGIAAAAIGALYAPWAPTLLAQMRSPFLAARHATIPAWTAAIELLRAPYASGAGGLFGAELALGFALVGVAACSLVAARGLPARGRALPWVAWFPLAFLVVDSLARGRLFDPHRHAVLFAAPLAVSAGVALALAAERGRGAKVAVATTLAAAIALAATTATVRRNHDFAPARDAIVERTPPDCPVYVVPPAYGMLSDGGFWLPLRIERHDAPEDVPLATPDFALAIVGGSGPEREPVMNGARTLVAPAREVVPVFESYEISVYRVRGLPEGRLRDYLAGTGAGNEGSFALGARVATATYDAADLARFCEPEAEVESAGTTPFGETIPGARIAGGETVVRPPPPPPATEAGAFAFAVEATIESVAASVPIALGADGDEVRAREFEPGPATFVALFPAVAARAGAGRGPALRIVCPPEDAADRFAVRILRGGWIPVTGDALRLAASPAGFDGILLDAGDAGDDLFFREGFHVREGMPPAQVRWTRGRFRVEFPVPEGAEPDEAVLFGLLPEAIRNREVRVRVATREGAIVARGSAIAETAEFGALAIPLDAPLPPGIASAEFELAEEWAPAESGGTDPRRLGFYLDAIGFRRAPRR